MYSNDIVGIPIVNHVKPYDKSPKTTWNEENFHMDFIDN
jgi:5-methylcytosine-specific restriction endonuclease McrA